MAALPNLMTVEQFRQLPEGGEFAYELHYGEVVAVTGPKFRHEKVQRRLISLLEPELQAFGEVTIELSYRAVTEFDLRVADVAGVARRRWNTINPDDNLHGAPDLVIEVKSPSNTARQLRELVALCLSHGAIECWIVETDKKSVTVMTRDGGALVYSSGSRIPLTRFGGGDLSVDDIFA